VPNSKVVSGNGRTKKAKNEIIILPFFYIEDHDFIKSSIIKPPILLLSASISIGFISKYVVLLAVKGFKRQQNSSFLF